MTFVLALVGYLVVYVAVALISERWSPLIGVGGLVAVLTVASWVA